MPKPHPRTPKGRLRGEAAYGPSSPPQASSLIICEQRYNSAGVKDVDKFRSKLRKLRLVQWALIAAVLMFVGVGELGGSPGSNDWTWQHWLVTGIALWAVWGGFRFRRRMLSRSKSTLAKDASDPRAAKQWQAGQLVALWIAQNIALLGLLVRVALGGALWQASMFYAASLALLLLWTPRLPTEPATT